MRNLALSVLLGTAGALMFTACHPVHVHHDDDRNEAPSLPPGGADFGLLDHFHQTYSESDFSNSGDTDGFEFSLARTSVVVITMTGTGGVDGFLELYDVHFGFLGGDDDGGPGNDPVIVGQLDAGDYFIVAGTFGSGGDYAVDISVEPTGGADFGIMGVPDSVLDSGGSLGDSLDVDSYIFTVTANCTCDIFLTRDSGDYDGNLQLMDEYGNQLAYLDPVGDADPALILQDLTPGTYIIRVGASFGSGAYTIQVDTY